MDDTRFYEGDLIEYRPGDGSVERGFVTSTNERFVFVRFGADTGSKACDPRDITRVRVEALPEPVSSECCASGKCEVCAPGGFGGSRYW